jgi:hypothetical protein
LQGILWVLRTGARWQDLPTATGRYPSAKTCHRYFCEWVQSGIFEKTIRALVEDLRERGKIHLAETFIDACFVEAKKGDLRLEKPRAERAPSSWQSSTMDLFLSPCLLRVLHHMRVDLLSQRFGPAILGTFLTDLSETKLTILLHLGQSLGEDFDASSLLPTALIEKSELKMDALYDATDEDGSLSDSLPGFIILEESKPDMSFDQRTSSP